MEEYYLWGVGLQLYDGDLKNLRKAFKTMKMELVKTQVSCVKRKFQVSNPVDGYNLELIFPEDIGFVKLVEDKIELRDRYLWRRKQGGPG